MHYEPTHAECFKRSARCLVAKKYGVCNRFMTRRFEQLEVQQRVKQASATNKVRWKPIRPWGTNGGNPDQKKKFARLQCGALAATGRRLGLE
jgi:hypothetical protein